MNIVTVEKSKPINSKMILKKLKVEEEVKTEILEMDINLRWEFSIYRYDIIDDFRQILTNIFFGDLIEIEQYRKKLKQYIKSVEKRKANKIKSIMAEEKPIYQSYVKLGWHQLQALLEHSKY